MSPLLIGLLALQVQMSRPPSDHVPVSPGAHVNGRTVSKPRWTRTPTLDQLAGLYPDLGLRVGLDGLALIECKVTLVGNLENCSVVFEEPKGYGFGEATIAAARLFQLDPADPLLKPPFSGRFRLPLRWRVPTLPPELQAPPSASGR